MQLSSTARKALAAGLAVSTIVWSMAMFVMPVAFAAPHGNGCLINQSGTIYLVENGVKRGFPSADVYASHGQNFGQVVTANSEDSSLPTGPVMVYRDGTLVKGPSDPLVYLVANGQKRGFISGAVYTGLGFSWNNVRTAAVNTFADLPTGANLESATEKHTNGILVKDSTNTIWLMTATGKKGVPSMEVFNSYGYRMSDVVPANAADVAAANEGVMTARVVCSDTPVVVGAVNVSAGSMTSSTLITTQSTAKLADFVFTGNGTVTSLTLKRVGISADSSLEDVFLFDGETRITDSASVTGGNINFTNSAGLFTISGSKTITVKADMSATAGQTVGVQLTAVTLSSGQVGGLPVSGPVHGTAAADLAGVALSAATDSGDTDATTDVIVWQGTAAVTTHNVNLTRLALRQIGSINSADIKNFKLLVDGAQVATVASLDSNGYVTFVMNKPMQTGNRILKVTADITGGASRTVEMSLRGSYDITVTDSEYGVNIEATASAFPFDADGFTVGQGTMTVNKATDSASGNITLNGTDVPLGKWTLTANGEPVKVETLAISFSYTEQTDNDNDDTPTLRNGRLLINGSQYGSTTTVATTGTSFTTNFVVNPGTPATVEFRADVYDNDAEGAGFESTDDIQVTLKQGSGNAIKQVSGGTLAVPAGDKAANSLNITQGSMTLAALASYPNQTTTAPQTNFKLGAWTLTGSSTEDVTLNTLSLDIDSVTNATFSEADLSNLYMKYGSNTTSVKSDPVAANNEWSISYTLVKNAVVTFELFGDIGAAADITNLDSVKTDLTISGTGVSSGAAVSEADKDGQTIIKNAGGFTTAKDASSPVAMLIDDSGTVDVAKFKIEGTYDTYTITEVDVNVASASAVQNVILKDGSTVLGTLPGSTSVLFAGLNVPVNGTKILTVALQMAPIGPNAGTSGSDVTVTLDNVKYRPTSTGTDTDEGANRAANAVYAFRAVPTITNVTLPTSVLGTGTQTLAKFTVNSNGTGTVAWKWLTFNVSKTGGAGDDPAISNPTLWDADTNTQITAGAGLAVNTLAAANTSGTIVFEAANEQEISGAKTYVLKATVTATLATGDNINTSIASSSTSLGDGAIVGTANDAATLAGTGANFVWSDESASSHSASTMDWYSDYLVKNLPTDSQTLTK